MNKAYIPCGNFSCITIEITNNLSPSKLITDPDNKKYWQYSEIIGCEKYREYIAMIIAKSININKDIYVSDILKRVYEVNNLEELEQHCKKLKADYSKILTNVYTLAKNDEIQKIYNDCIDRFERILKDNINYIYFGVDKDGNKIEDEVIK